MKKVCVYECADGKQFANKNLAFKHDLELELIERFAELSDPLFKACPDAKRLLPVILADPVPFRDALSEYIKRANLNVGANKEKQEA